MSCPTFSPSIPWHESLPLEVYHPLMSSHTHEAYTREKISSVLSYPVMPFPILRKWSAHQSNIHSHFSKSKESADSRTQWRQYESGSMPVHIRVAHCFWSWCQRQRTFQDRAAPCSVYDESFQGGDMLEEWANMDRVDHIFFVEQNNERLHVASTKWVSLVQDHKSSIPVDAFMLWNPSFKESTVCNFLSHLDQTYQQTKPVASLSCSPCFHWLMGWMTLPFTQSSFQSLSFYFERMASLAIKSASSVLLFTTTWDTALCQDWVEQAKAWDPSGSFAEVGHSQACLRFPSSFSFERGLSQEIYPTYECIWNGSSYTLHWIPHDDVLQAAQKSGFKLVSSCTLQTCLTTTPLSPNEKTLSRMIMAQAWKFCPSQKETNGLIGCL